MFLKKSKRSMLRRTPGRCIVGVGTREAVACSLIGEDFRDRALMFQGRTNAVHVGIGNKQIRQTMVNLNARRWGCGSTESTQLKQFRGEIFHKCLRRSS